MQELNTFLSNHPQLSIAIAALLVLLAIVELLRTKKKRHGVQPQQAIFMMNHENGLVLDLRPTEAFRNGHIIEALSLTAADMKNNPKKIEKFKNRPLIIVCQAGVESEKIAAQLRKHGYNAFSLMGGMRAWNDAQMPMIKER